ncbi:MAG: molybdenum cofactor biosynthesis protein MoaB [Bacteroidetes bacterium]|nr:molybdenum cofactor biosynthesis protein MoaB [Bacteroidota bacterium]
MGYDEHEQQAKQTPVRCSVVTVSDTRTVDTDTSGKLVRDLLTAAGHPLAEYQIVKDEPEQLTSALEILASNSDVIIFNGGTGISKRDSTVDTLVPLFEKRLPGFGEIFRVLSFSEIGAAAMLSRAEAGVFRDTIVFLTPGSTNAVRLAMERLIVPQLKHLVWEILRQKT